MIKAQYVYMDYIGSKCDYLASTTLFGYNRGDGFVRKTYIDSILRASWYKMNYHLEGISYVEKIFNYLNKYFGYNLDMTFNSDVLLKT